MIITNVFSNGVDKKLLNPVSKDENKAEMQNKNNDKDMAVILMVLCRIKDSVITPISKIVKTQVIKYSFPTNENKGIDKNVMPSRQRTYNSRFFSEKILDRNFFISEIPALSTILSYSWQEKSCSTYY